MYVNYVSYLSIHFDLLMHILVTTMKPDLRLTGSECLMALRPSFVLFVCNKD